MVMKYTTENLGESDNTIRSGAILESLHNLLKNLYTNLPALKEDYRECRDYNYTVSPEPILDRIRETRTTAENYMKRAKDFTKEYPDSKVVQGYLNDMEKILNKILEETTKEKIERIKRY